MIDNIEYINISPDDYFKKKIIKNQKIEYLTLEEVIERYQLTAQEVKELKKKMKK